MKKAKSRSCFQIYIISENLRHTKTQSVLTRSKSNPITLRLTRFCITSNPEHCGQRPPNINASNCNISFVLFFIVAFSTLLASLARSTKLISSLAQFFAPELLKVIFPSYWCDGKQRLKKVFFGFMELSRTSYTARIWALSIAWNANNNECVALVIFYPKVISLPSGEKRLFSRSLDRI